MVKAILQGKMSGIAKPVNFYKVRGITQEEKENPASFYGRLEEDFKKHTNIDSSSREGVVLLSQHFQKLQSLQLGPQTNKTQLWNVAFPVYHNCNLEEERKGQGKK
jgi:hypothetical protein